MSTHLTPRGTSTPRPKSIAIDELMGSAREVILRHADDEYRLRITSKGKLILTK
jgi:hemin uptake protein HemP